MKNSHDLNALIRRRIGVAALAWATAATLAACGSGGGSSDSDADVNVPQAPAKPSVEETAAARVHIFGAENVDPLTGEINDKTVLFSWLSGTTYAAAVNGNVVLLDASLLRREDVPGRTPTTRKELVALMPTHIFLSQASQGHADLAADIGFRTGATIVGAAEHCATVQADARALFGGDEGASLLKCIEAAPAASTPGDRLTSINLADIGVCVRPVKNIVSASVANDPAIGLSSFDWGANSDQRDADYWPEGEPASDGVTTGGTNDSPAMLYHFSMQGQQNFSFLWNGHAGPIKESAPGIASMLRQLPKTDVQIGSVSTENAVNNGLRDPALYIANVEPKIFFPSGHDAAAQAHGAYATAEFVKRALDDALDAVSVTGEHRPDVRFLYDPIDYASVLMRFDPAAPAWTRGSDRVTDSSCAN